MKKAIQSTMESAGRATVTWTERADPWLAAGGLVKPG